MTWAAFRMEQKGRKAMKRQLGPLVLALRQASVAELHQVTVPSRCGLCLGVAMVTCGGCPGPSGCSWFFAGVYRAAERQQEEEEEGG